MVQEIKNYVTGNFAKFLKFSVIGGSGIFVNMSVLWLLTDIFNLFYLLSSIMAIALAMINNFVWNDLWTWKKYGEPGVRNYLVRLGKFCLIASFSGYGVNLSILWILTDFFDVYYLIANLIGIGAGMLLNFTLNNKFTFKPVANENQV